MIGWAGQWTQTPSATSLQPKNEMHIFGLHSTSDDQPSWSMDSNPICHPSPARKMKCSFLAQLSACSHPSEIHLNHRHISPDPDLDPDIDLDLDPDLEPDPEPDPELDLYPELELDLEPEPQPQPDLVPEPELDLELDQICNWIQY